MNIERGMRGWDGDRDESDRRLDSVDPIEAPRVDRLDITDEDVKRAYDENLDLVLERVEELLPRLNGKTVITADHGELIGDRVFPLPRKRYEHPIYLHTPELCVVPWFSIESDDRRDVRSDPPQRYDATDEEEVEEKLRALGYK